MSDPAPLLPPELALDEPPISPPELEQLLDWVETNTDPEGLPPETPASSWLIQDDGQAEWAMRHLAEADANLAALNEQAAAYLARITAWHEAARHRVTTRRIFFAGHLEAWAMKERQATGRKSFPLPSGTVRTTLPTKPTVDVVDEPAVVEWAAGNLEDDQYAEVVKSTVRLTQFRALTGVADGVTDRLVVTLDCGCQLVTELVENPDSLLGLEMDCDATPEHGAQPVVGVQPEEALVAVDASGQIIPGTRVVQPKLTAKATPSL